MVLDSNDLWVSKRRFAPNVRASVGGYLNAARALGVWYAAEGVGLEHDQRVDQRDTGEDQGEDRGGREDEHLRGCEGRALTSLTCS